jgi:Fic family protein
MRPTDFKPSSPGRLVDIGGGFHAFLPASVPRELQVSSHLAKLVGDTRGKLGSLNEGVRSLPSSKIFLRPFQKREAVLSSRIEGTVTTLDEAFLSAAIEEDDELVDDGREVSNYEQALHKGVDTLAKGRRLNVQLLKALHRELLRGVRGDEKQPGAIRTRQAFVASRTVQERDDARFVPPPPHALVDCLEDFDAYLAERGSDEGLVRIALAHYQFETIHPFADGNGRTGRLLVALQMVWEGVLDEPFLYVSPMLERRRKEYYDGLLRVSQTGDFVAWIEFFVSSVRSAADETLDRLGRLRSLVSVFEEKLRKHQTQKPVQLAKQLLAFPYITVPIAKRLLGVPQSATAQQAIDKLVDAGILSLTDVRPRVVRGRPPKLYRCSGVLDIIRE